MPISSARLKYTRRVLTLLAATTLAGCGGGGTSSEATSSTATSAPLVGNDVTAATTATAASAAITEDDDSRLAQAVASSTESADITAPGSAAASPTATLASDVASAAVATMDMSPAVEATPVVAANAPTSSIQAVYQTSVGRVLYVDSQLGNDANNGTSASNQANGTGPWKSLSKLTTTTLLPGDTVKLACGSVWSETLRLSASGAADNPITITAASSNCSVRPAIDGSTQIDTTAWALHQGSIYKTTLAAAPLQLFAGSGYMLQAHHPNRGHDIASPRSLYLKAAADSNKITVNAREGSDYLVTGTDLKLPAGAAVTAGTTVRMRTNAYIIDEAKVAAVAGSRVTLNVPTTFPISSGWGYYLLGQLWMLDSAGEWHYEPSTKTLYVWTPDSRAPDANVRVSQLATGIDLQSLKHITIDGLAVRKARIGINARRSTGVSIRNVRVDDSAAAGIDASASDAAMITDNTVTRSAGNGITGVDYTVGWATNMQVRRNTVTDSGVAMSGETVLSLPVRSYAAIRPGHASVVDSNVVRNAGYVGVWPGTSSAVTNNAISGACTVLDDCGAIYTSRVGARTMIKGNMIWQSRGAVDGKPSATSYTQAQGIYLDESASACEVTGNTVTDTDNGIQIHVSSNNLIQENNLYGNRKSQIWLQENRNIEKTSGDLYANTITGNQIVAVATNSRHIHLDTLFADTVHFGSFNANRYYDRLMPNVVDERVGTSLTAFNLTQWKAARNAAGASRGNDTTGWGASEMRFATTVVTGPSIVPNGSMTTNLSGWATWNQTLPKGSLVREACTAGWCGRYVTGGSSGIVSSPNFSITAGNWYRLSVDVATGAASQLVDLVVRRGGGGTNSYETLSDRGTRFNASGPWARYSVVFKATKTVNAADPITRDLGARIDIQNLKPGQTLSLANLELMPIAPTDATTRSDLLANKGGVPIQAACPVAGTQPALCNSYVRLTDNAPISWPIYLAARSSEIVFTRDASLVDSDQDGIADAQDACANTPAGRAVNSRGCSLI